MSTGVQAPRLARLSLSRVAEQTFALVGRDFVPLFLVAFGVMLLPGLLAAFRVQTTVGSGLAPVASLTKFGPLFWLTTVLSFACATLVYASLSWAAAERMQGRNASPGEMLAAGLRALPALIAIGVLAYVGIVIGTLCLFVPGVFLALAWSMVAPVVAVERRGVFGGFGRSFELTRDNRWVIFLILLVYGIGCLLAAVLVLVLLRFAFGATGNPFMPQVTSGPALWVSTGVNLLLGSVLRVVGATGLGVMYSELRGASGGFDARRLTDVFA
jgi:hypothetical protein